VNGTLFHGNCLDLLRSMPADSVDACCSDPPFGISLMGRAWDIDVPSVEILREVLRVLKPGAFCLMMTSPRQDVHAKFVTRLQEAGFEVGFSSINWIYLSGFPKAVNVSKIVDKRLGGVREKKPLSGDGSRYLSNAGNHQPWMDDPDHQVDGDEPATPEAAALQGAYAAMNLKPAHETVLVAMKKLTEASYTAQALANGKGVSWCDAARIPCDEVVVFSRPNRVPDGKREYNGSAQWTEYEQHPSGRFPANVLVSNDALNDGRNVDGGNGAMKRTPNGHSADKTRMQNSEEKNQFSYGDSGSASRMFSLDAWWAARVAEFPERIRRVFPSLLIPKPSKAEKDAGLGAWPVRKCFSMNAGGREAKGPDGEWDEVTRNTHPSCKPIELMAWLIALVTRPGDLVLDPYSGSGSTLIAAELLERRWVGAEMEAESHAIALARLAWWADVRAQHNACGDTVPVLEVPITQLVARFDDGAQLGLFDTPEPAPEAHA
jgi:site-specific DNA-methyltransferase (adenine-specific)